MKKLLLFLILVVVNNSAVAEWILISENDQLILYSNPVTIIKSGNMVRMIRLTNFKTAQRINGKSYLSTKRQDEYDCLKQRYRIIYVNAYTENMGEGKVVIRVINKPDDWKLISSGSQGEAVWSIACGE
jgi:hypothetical protein